ncbi:protein of unknown function [Cupriavidus taiwanensis]|nr:protein of unknown function [Cupriavidus taiwanensis]
MALPARPATATASNSRRRGRGVDRLALVALRWRRLNRARDPVLRHGLRECLGGGRLIRLRENALAVCSPSPASGIGSTQTRRTADGTP